MKSLEIIISLLPAVTLWIVYNSNAVTDLAKTLYWCYCISIWAFAGMYIFCAFVCGATTPTEEFINDAKALINKRDNRSVLSKFYWKLSATLAVAHCLAVGHYGHVITAILGLASLPAFWFAQALLLRVYRDKIRHNNVAKGASSKNGRQP